MTQQQRIEELQILIRPLEYLELNDRLSPFKRENLNRRRAELKQIIAMTKVVKPTMKGDCYEVHASAFLEGFLGETGGLLCHGTVWHPDVGRHGHCWLELNEDVVADYSNGHGVVVRRETYYAIGKVRDVRRYTVEQARALVLKEGTYGPWEAQGIMTKGSLHDSSGGV